MNYSKLKYLNLLLLIIISFLGYDCRKKISKYDFNLQGKWYAPSSNCGLVLMVESNSQAKLVTIRAHFCGSGGQLVKGTMKFKDDYFYIDKNKDLKMKVIEKPQIHITNDSINAPDENDFSTDKYYRRKVLARMVLQIKNGWGSQENFDFAKYSE